jgi:hypothetical protein
MNGFLADFVSVYFYFSYFSTDYSWPLIGTAVIERLIGNLWADSNRNQWLFHSFDREPFEMIRE